MATTGGNLMQRTRCYYFMDTTFPACNKRSPGTGCAALKGFNRIHAILGQTDEGPTSPHTCIATNPSDMNVALSALFAKIEVIGPNGKRSIPIHDFHRLPGKDPALDTTLKPDELIVAVTLPPAKFAKNSWYLKARDRQSYAFALVSVAAGLELDGSTIKSAGLALGGVAHKPWRSGPAIEALIGKPATAATFKSAADIALTGAQRLPRQCVQDRTRQTMHRPRPHPGHARSPGIMQATETLPPPVQLDHRYEGISKVTGTAKYVAEFTQPFPRKDLAYAFIVQSTIPSGTIASMDQNAAERAPGVLAVLTPFNAPKLPP